MSALRNMSIKLSSGIELSYAESGDAEGLPLLMLPGMTDSWHSFGPPAENLPRRIRTIALSQRGHGDSTKPLGCYGIAELAQDAVEVLDHLGIDRAAVLGHCLGSLVAMRMAADAPERVSGLVLIGALRTFKNNSSAEAPWCEVARMTDPVDPDFVRAFQQSTLARPIAAPHWEDPRGVAADIAAWAGQLDLLAA